MAADPQRQEASSNDLFGRWLAHHEQQVTEQGESAGVDDITSDSSPPPRASRRLPAAAVASSALERDPLIGSRIAPPSTFGARRPSAKAPEHSGSTNELDREPPPGWEPIVMRSIRKKTEQAEAKHVPKPDTRSRLQRLKARLVDPTEPEAEVEVPEVPLTPPVARSVPLPVAQPKPPLPTRTPASPAAAAPATRSLEETIRAAVPTVERQVAKHAEPRVDEEPAVEQPVEPHVARHAEPRVEPRVEPRAEQPVEQPVEQFAPVGRHSEPEEVAPPTPVRAFIAVEPEPYVEPYVEPEPVAIEPEAHVEPEPEPYVEPVAYVEPEPESEPESVVVEPEPEPVAESVVAESVVAESEPEPVVLAEPIPVEPPVDAETTETTETTETADTTEDQPGRRTFLSLPKRQPKAPKRRQDRPRTGDTARDQIAAKVRVLATSPAPQPLEATPKVVPPAAQQSAVAVAAPPEPEVVPLKVSKHDKVATEMPGVYKFAAKRTSRRMLTIALLAGIAGSTYFVRAAVEVKDTPSIGLAAIVILATVMIWAIRGGASLTTLEVHQGQLQVVQQGGRYVFDLASQYTRFEVHGEPGHRGWKVLFPRRGMAPFTVDASMVDPDDFMRVLRFFRPQLVNH
jgi:hypothetical protein